MRWRITLLILCLFMTLCIPMTAGAADEGKAVPHDAITCPYCESVSAQEYCAGDAVAAVVETHSYRGGTCTITRYDCKAGIYCFACNRSSLYGWRHPCYVIHRGCGESKWTMCYISGIPMPPG